MKRSLHCALILVCLRHSAVARADETAPASESPAVLPAAVAPTSAGPDASSVCRQPDGHACCEPVDDRPFGLVGGADFYWMQPYFTNNPAFTVTQFSPTGPGGNPRAVTSRANLGNHMEV